MNKKCSPTNKAPYLRKILLPVFRTIIKPLFKMTIKSSLGNELEGYHLAKKIYYYLVSLVRTDVAQIRGHKMFLGPEDDLGLSIYGEFVKENFETELVEKEIKKGDVVLDLGANIGYYTLIFAKLVGDTGKVFAFEPDPTNFALLEKNVQANGYNNVVLVQKAVSNKTGKINLYLSESHLAHTIYDLGNHQKSIEVDTVCLDDYFKNYGGKINFIKMDIEGAEGCALQGMSSLLENNNSMEIITEFLPDSLKESDVQPEEFLASLIKHGFKLYHLDEQKERVRSITTAELIRMCPGRKYTNILCIK